MSNYQVLDRKSIGYLVVGASDISPARLPCNRSFRYLAREAFD